MARRSRFNGIPADLARKGDCGAAHRAVESMKPGVVQDYERERVEDLCSIGPEAPRFDGLSRKGNNMAKRKYAILSSDLARGRNGRTGLSTISKHQTLSAAKKVAKARSMKKNSPYVCVGWPAAFRLSRGGVGYEERHVCYRKGKQTKAR